MISMKVMIGCMQVRARFFVSFELIDELKSSQCIPRLQMNCTILVRASDENPFPNPT